MYQTWAIYGRFGGRPYLRWSHWAQRTQYLIYFCVSDVVSISVVLLLTFGSSCRVLLLEGVVEGYGMLSEMWSILFVLVIVIRMLGQSSVLGVARYHGSWPWCGRCIVLRTWEKYKMGVYPELMRFWVEKIFAHLNMMSRMSSAVSRRWSSWECNQLWSGEWYWVLRDIM